MRGGPVVLNNTPLVGLWLLDRFDLLRELFDHVLIPQAVRDEFLAVDPAPRRRALLAAPWIEVRRISNERRVLSYSGLDRGEAEVLALAEDEDTQLVVLDERKARKYAARLGFPLTGTVGILLLAKERGFLSSVEEALGRLQQQGFHLHADLIARALELAGESLPIP